MTLRGRFFTREEYQQLVYGALVDFPGRIKTLTPAIIKPEQLWSGKQIISTLLLNLTPEDKSPVNLISNAAVKPNNFSKGKNNCPHLDLRNLCESRVIFRQGQMVQGANRRVLMS